VYPSNLRRFLCSFAAALVLMMLAKPGSAQERIEAWKVPHFSIEPEKLYQAASSIEEPENANIAILEDDEGYSFDADGRCIHTEYVIYKILNQSGAEGWDSVTVDWEPWHQARPSIKVRVISRDLSVHMLDAKQITEAPARGGEYKTYGDGKSLRAPFPAIAPGAVVEEEFITSETVPFFGPGHVGRIFFGREGVPVEHSVAELDAPTALPLRSDTVKLGNLQPLKTESNGRISLTYEKGRLEAWGPSEPNLPPEESRFPIVEFSTGESWQAMARAYSQIVDQKAVAAAVQPVVDGLIVGTKTTAEKEAAILAYLDREIRYTGIEFDEAAIIPHELPEILAHKYGDCKDKATLLATMLRAAGIPAYVALLNAGSRMDVPADLPGMGLFDHAIVYVPGSPALWIDATDPWARLGQLPSADQGRWALIARPETTGLTKTYESTSKENVLLETREITLAENGPAGVKEVTEPTGVFEGEYRGFYADKPDKDMREGLSAYVKAQYISEKLISVERTDPVDLSKPFALTLACDKAKRGYTDLDNAVAAIRAEGMFQNLPGELQRKDDSEDKKKDDGDRARVPRTEDWELPEPFSADWHYRIVPPEGFIAKDLPQSTHVTLGPAVLTEEFALDKDGAVLAHLNFDSVKRRYTVAEATELRNKVVEIAAGPAILINFEPHAEALLRDGKVRDALASYRSLVASHPSEAVHHLQVAKVLLGAGMGEAARAEAREAVQLEPGSALGEKTLATILKQDLVGRNIRAGSDMAGAAEAYRAAIKLDPDDHGTQGDLAILYEYDPVGRRYGRQSKMKEAIEEYQSLGQDKLAELGLANNLAFSLFYGGQYADALKVARTLNPEPNALIAASVAMIDGGKAGLAEANKRATDDNAYKETARVAGEMLMNIRQYPLASDFLAAGASGDNSAQTMGLANLLRSAQRHEDLKFENTPQDLVKRFVLLSMDPELTEEKMLALSSRNAAAVIKKEDPEEIKKALETGKKMNMQLARDDSSMDVTLDLLMQAFDPKSEGSDSTGYRVKVQIPGENTSTFFVVKEDGQYKLLDTNEKPNAAAMEILDRIQSGNLPGAKALLDWLREDQHLEGGDDPLGGPVFPRFWIKGEAADAAKMKLAAAAILVGTKPTAGQGIGLLEAARTGAATEREKTNIEIALAVGYAMEEDYTKLQEVASDLAKQVPESRFAFLSNVDALIGLNRFDDASALANQRLKLLENDNDAMMAQLRIESSRGNFDAARNWGQKIVSHGKEDASVLNSIAWFALFTGKVNQEDIATAIKATQMSKDNPAILHTLACLYAEAGQPKDAHDLLLRGMDDLNLQEPDDDYWYAFGRIAEDYGEREIAIADYRKLAKPKDPVLIPTSTYVLAQARLKVLEAK